MRAYVAISRIKSLAGLYILHEFEFEVITTLAKHAGQECSLAISTELELEKNLSKLIINFFFLHKTVGNLVIRGYIIYANLSVMSHYV